ncbi:hypothetical protein [Mycobacteroides abscessus]|uniref:hypothetical protein n=1 Tax=Mycobacteroides abscessus TaxID=36809 RepID=UPI000926D87C|nr:hypothetical protein [Mycobacteroides abscessus]SIC60011.1 Uncharacterised protein [Mycobacteroides abscessus subsp. abscessus]
MASESSKQTNPPGVYRHEGSGKEITVEHDAITGSAQADALVRLGYVYVGEAEAAQEAQATGSDGEGAPEKSGKPLKDYKLKQLVEIAKELGVENAEELGKPGATKDAAIAAIEAAQEAQGNE